MGYESPACAAKFLDAWCKRAMRSRIDPVKKVARTVRAHRELLLNYSRVKKKFSRGVIEGLCQTSKRCASIEVADRPPHKSSTPLKATLLR